MFEFLDSQHPNIKFTMKKETNRILAFLDVCIDNNDPSCLKISVCRTKTFTGLLSNFLNFTSFSYKVGLILTLVDRAYNINNSILGQKLNDLPQPSLDRALYLDVDVYLL